MVGLVVGTGLVAPLHSTKKAAEEKSERDVAEKSESDGREIRKGGGAEKRGKDGNFGKQSTFSKTVLSFGSVLFREKIGRCTS